MIVFCVHVIAFFLCSGGNTGLLREMSGKLCFMYMMLSVVQFRLRVDL